MTQCTLLHKWWSYLEIKLKFCLHHTVLQHACISLFAFSRGQLGHGDTRAQSCLVPVESLEGVQILSVHAGGWHAGAITGGDYGIGLVFIFIVRVVCSYLYVY